MTRPCAGISRQQGHSVLYGDVQEGTRLDVSILTSYSSSLVIDWFDEDIFAFLIT